MKIKDCKCYIPFILSVILFGISLFWFASTHIDWNASEEEQLEFEIKLPVIEWNKYTSLSKQLEVNKID
jgi:hypothetical protein